MQTLFARFVIALLALAVSAQTRFAGVPVLWLIACVMALALAALVLCLVRSGVRDGWLRLGTVTA